MTKRYLMYVAGKNLGVIMRSLFGMGKPRTLQAEGAGGFASIWAKTVAIAGQLRSLGGSVTRAIRWAAQFVARHNGISAQPIMAAA